MGLCYSKLLQRFFFLSLSSAYFKKVNVEWKRLAAGLVPSIKHNQDPVGVEMHSHMVSTNCTTWGHIWSKNYYQPANIRPLNKTAFVTSLCSGYPCRIILFPHVRCNGITNKVGLGLNWPSEAMRHQFSQAVSPDSSNPLRKWLNFSLIYLSVYF